MPKKSAVIVRLLKQAAEPVMEYKTNAREAKIVTRRVKVKGGEFRQKNNVKIKATPPTIRISAEAAIEAQKLLKKKMGELAIKVQAQTMQREAKTIKKDDVEFVLENMDVMPKCCLKACQKTKARKKNQRDDISEKKVVKMFNVNLRMTAMTKRCLVAVAESYVRNLGSSAARFANSAKRPTILVQDIIDGKYCSF